MSQETAAERPDVLPSQRVQLDQLRAGLVVLRWTDNLANHKVRAPLPCHERQTVEALAVAAGVVCICRACSRTYRLSVSDDNDGGYSAVFVVAAEQFQLSRARKVQ